VPPGASEEKLRGFVPVVSLGDRRAAGVAEEQIAAVQPVAVSIRVIARLEGI